MGQQAITFRLTGDFMGFSSQRSLSSYAHLRTVVWLRFHQRWLGQENIENLHIFLYLFSLGQSFHDSSRAQLKTVPRTIAFLRRRLALLPLPWALENQHLRFGAGTVALHQQFQSEMILCTRNLADESLTSPGVENS